MKKAIFSLLIMMTFSVSAQKVYWSNYSVVVEPQNQEIMYKLINDYFTANKPEGVTVILYENHFNDHENDYTNILSFSGTLDALGDMYARDGGAAWKLFLVQLNQQVKEGFAALTGTVITTTGDLNLDLPMQKYFIVHADDGDTFDKAYAKYMTTSVPEGMVAMMGNITAGVSPNGENRWVLNGFKDFKSALGGAEMMRTDAQNTASTKAWKEFLATNGGSRLVRSGLWVRMGKW